MSIITARVNRHLALYEETSSPALTMYKVPAYKQLVRPTLEDAAKAWDCSPQTQESQVEAVQRRVTRLVRVMRRTYRNHC